MRERTREEIAVGVSWRSVVINLLLTLFKLLAGIFSNSAAMLSDAVHTASDVLSTLVVIVGVKLAGRASDEDHPYGHDRFECVAAIVLAALLTVTGLGVGYGGLMKIFSSRQEAMEIPGVPALIAAGLSIVVKEGMYWYARAAAKRINSSALMADAWHHRSDAFSSVGSFAAILGARLGFPILDPVACLVICVFIVKAAVHIFLDAIGRMTDRSCDEKTVTKLRGVILSQRDVLDIDKLRTRVFGDKIYVDIEICVRGDASLQESHQTAHRVHDAVETHFPQVKHCMVHMNPSEENKA